ncbi:MAG TPA: ABC transporter ATP-binding protein [Tepidisphaeraceae bacterium]|jgi:molybdate transport system ATP-binding protein|nr:ABC transporter ATP-binding protein [Tepidisphaeraceae bacterium]
MSHALIADFEHRHDSGTIVRARLQQDDHSARITVLFGPSGSGKTTILRCLAGLDRPHSGIIRLGSNVWFDSAHHIHLRPQQRGVGYLFQEYALFPHLRVDQNIGYGLSRPGRHGRVGELMELLGLRGLKDRYPHELSAGQRQRVALARAVAPKPKLLLLDEPLSALDAPTRQSLRGELRRLLTQLATPAVVVTHDPIEAVALADRAVVLTDGHVLQEGPISEVFSRPASPEVARIVGIETIEPATVERVQNGLATVRAGNVELVAVARDVRPGPVYLCIRGEEVILERGQPAQSSARNQLVAKVSWMSPEGALIRVGLDCGFRLTALITRPASEQLLLREGETVTALVKAPSIHLVSR